jgi:hypothetical protein
VDARRKTAAGTAGDSVLASPEQPDRAMVVGAEMIAVIGLGVNT